MEISAFVSQDAQHPAPPAGRCQVAGEGRGVPTVHPAAGLGPGEHPDQSRVVGLQVRGPQGEGEGRHVAGQHPL